MAGAIEAGTPTPELWLSRFRQRYDESASDPITELGVFYERNRGSGSVPEHPWTARIEYTDAEWTQVLSVFLSRLAREFGLYQTWEFNGRNDLAWFRPGQDWRLNTVIAQVNRAEDDVIERELPALVSSGAELVVLLLYPDYPLPRGTESFEEAEGEWRRRLERELARLRPTMPFLVAMISAYAWTIPAPWHGSAWDPQPLLLRPL